MYEIIKWKTKNGLYHCLARRIDKSRIKPIVVFENGPGLKSMQDIICSRTVDYINKQFTDIDVPKGLNDQEAKEFIKQKYPEFFL